MSKRGFDCHYYAIIDNKLFKNFNTACWAGVTNIQYWNEYDIEKRQYKNINQIPSTIYINNFINEKITKREDLINILNIINKLTTCKLIIIEDKEYIEYELILDKNYEANLLLLNFIRLLWYEENNLNFEQYYKDIANYNDEEPFLFLTTCLKNNVILDSNLYYGDHSHVLKNIIPKTFEDVKKSYTKYPHRSASSFLQLKNID